MVLPLYKVKKLLVMNIFKSTSIRVLSLILLFPFTALAWEATSPKHYVCYRTSSPLNIDGKATEPCWKNATWTDNFVDIVSEQKAVPRFQTRAKMVWDDDFLYVFAEISEPHIWGNVKKRDETIFVDNDFEVFIDPDGDTHNYYEYEMNALNTEWDLLLTRPYRDGGEPITSWNFVGMKSAVHLDGTINNPGDTDRKWTAEIAFPMKSFADSTTSIPVKPGTHWRVNFSRVEWQTKVENGQYVKIKEPKTGKPLPEDNWVWSPQGVINMHCPETWGFVQFSEHVAGTAITPFLAEPEDKVKDELRLLYYAQQKYHAINHHYSDNLKEFINQERTGKKWDYNPKLTATPKGYLITAKRMQSSKLWHINETGRVWAKEE